MRPAPVPPSGSSGGMPLADDARFRALIEQSADAIILLDAASAVVYSSPSTSRLTGYTAAERLGRPGFELLHPDDAGPIAEELLRLHENPGGTTRVEYRLQHKDGSWRWIESVLTNLLNEPSVQAIVVNYRDITAQRAAEAELRSSRDQLQAILQSVADGITVQDPSGQLLYANEAAAHLIGFPSVSTLLAETGSTVLQRFRVLDEEGRPFDLSRLPGRIAIEEQRSAEATLRYQVLATGEEHWSNVRSMPVLDHDGEVQFAVTAFQEITRLKQVEAAFRYLAEAGSLLAASLDYETTLQTVARLAVPILADTCVVDLLDDDGRLHRLAVSVPEGLKAAPVWAVDQTPFNPEAAHGPARVLRTGISELIPEVTDELLITAARGPEHLALLRRSGVKSHMIVPLRSRERMLGLLTFVSTTSGRRYSEQDLVLAEELAGRAALAVDNARLYQEAQAALAEARTALATRSQFLSVASHELRTPLTSLKGQLQLVLRRLRRGGTEITSLIDSLEVVNRQADRLSRLVEELLNVSRLEAGRVVIFPEPVDVPLLLAQVIEAEHAIEPSRSIELATQEGVPPLQADLARLEQVLINLLENARKYSPPHQPISIDLTSTDDEVVIAVRDLGIGIPPEDQQRIFEPFLRAGNVDSGVPGMGLGLYITAEIVRAHGGTLTVESATDKGSTFTVRLPRVGAVAQQDH